jgi:Ca-activated chloride channel family protein
VIERFEWTSPWLLLAGPAAVLLLLLTRDRGRRLVRYSAVALTDGLSGTWRTRLVRLPTALFVVGLLLAGIALARPRLGDERSVTRTEGIAITLVVDVSSSMLAHDFTDENGRPTDRLTAVKEVVRDFVEGDDGLLGRPSDLVGLVTFAGYADDVCPLTLDHRLLLDTLDAARIAQAEWEDGTSIAQGLARALGRLQDAPSKSRVVVLLTDGVHNDATTDPREVAKVAAELGVKVYTIGMGSNGPVPYPVRTPSGEVQFVRRQLPLDDALLDSIAQETGALYRRAGTTEALREIYGEIDELERTQVQGVTYRSWRELFVYPLAACLALWVIALTLEATALRRVG